MTKRERAQVVELLRCGADLFVSQGNGIGAASSFLLSQNAVFEAAVTAWDETVTGLFDLRGFGYAEVCLEAAARVEEGSSP
jgi:hypothetical protein